MSVAVRGVVLGDLLGAERVAVPGVVRAVVPWVLVMPRLGRAFGRVRVRV
jgi:hypothetical protein